MLLEQRCQCAVRREHIAGLYEWQAGAVAKCYEGGAFRRAGYTGDNGVFYALSDHLKSTSALVNQDGTLNDRNYYYPYGGNRGGAAFSGLTTKRFTGQYHEQGLPGGEGLSYYNARWYDAQVGVFISADTIVPSPLSPQSLNRYSYVGGNPLLYLDPSGHLKLCGAACEDSYNWSSPTKKTDPAGITLDAGRKMSPKVASQKVRAPRLSVASPTTKLQSGTPLWMQFIREASKFVSRHTEISSGSKSVPRVSPEREKTARIASAVTVSADTVATAFSIAGASIETASTTATGGPGIAVGLATYYAVINPLENSLSAVSVVSTIVSDFASGNSQISPGSVTIGQDSIVSLTTAIAGSLPFVEGFLDTGINVPLSGYDANRAGGRLATYFEFHWETGRPWYIQVYLNRDQTPGTFNSQPDQ